MPFALVQGLRTRYRETGAGRPGTPVVFIHGAAGSSVTWLGPLRQLGRTHRCFAPDLPGHGQSAPAPGETTVAALRDFIGHLCDALHVERVVLVGHSMGGAVALEAALAWPARVAGLVLCATAGRLPVAPAVFDVIDRHFDDLPELFAQAAFSPETPRDLALRLARLSVQAPRPVVRADFDACHAWDARERIGAIRAPTVVLVGEDDRMTPAKHGRAVAERISSARTTAFAHAGHMLHLEAPLAVAEAVRSLG